MPDDERSNVGRVVAFVHVADVDESVAFYAKLGFSCTEKLAFHGRTGWAWLTTGSGDLMLSCASGTIEADKQAVLLYMYSSDVRGLRTRLVRDGLTDRGDYRGQPLSGARAGEVFEVSSPSHMRAGELRVHDPDGYCLLIGQLE